MQNKAGVCLFQNTQITKRQWRWRYAYNGNAGRYNLEDEAPNHFRNQS
jgi:hypothetical protein